MSHTSGPWQRDGWCGIVAVINGEKRSVARVYWENDRLAEAEANERLIEAAPDLLAACERMLEAPTVAARMAAKSAVKKARGE